MKFVIDRQKFLPSQRKFWDLQTYIKGFVAGYGSGKTRIGGLRTIRNSHLNAGVEGLVISPSYGMADKTIVPTIESFLDKAGVAYTHNKSKHYFDIHAWDGFFWYASGDDPNSLRGPNIAWTWIDEPFIQRHDVFKQAMARTRHPDAKLREIYFTGTAEELNWGYDICHNPGELDVSFVRGSTRENHYLPADYLASMLAGFSEEEIAAYIDGEFVNLTSGRAYKDFNRDLIQKRTGLEQFPIVVGMDFNINPLCAAIGRELTNGVHWEQEIVLRNATTYEMAAKLQTICPGARVYPDPAGSAGHTSSSRSDHQIFRDAGFQVIAKRKHPAVKDRVSAVNALLRNELMTVDPSCQFLIADLERVVWRKTGELDQVKDKDRTHMTDGVGYYVDYKFPVSRGFVGTIQR